MLEKLRKRLQEVLTSLQVLNAKVVDEKGNARMFTDEEKAENDKLTEEAKSLRAAIQREVETMEAQAELRALEQPVGEVPAIQVTRNENENEKGEYRGFRSFGEQLIAVRNETVNKITDKRLAELRAASGANQAVDQDGGILVQTDFMAMLEQLAMEGSALAPYCSEHPVSSNSNGVTYPELVGGSRADGVRSGGVVAYWEGEADAYTASKAKFTSQEVKLKKLIALTHVTDEMLEDAAFLESWISRLYQEEMGFKVDAAIMEGSGAGMPYGILNSPALVSVAKKSGQAADTVVTENATKVWSAVLPGSKSKGVWIINNEVWDQLPLMTLGNMPLFIPPGGISNNLNGTIFGRPVIVAEAANKLGDAGDFGFYDLTKYLLVKKGVVKKATSIHVKFETGEQSFRFTQRLNGQPMMREAITPYKANSGVKNSAFVTVVERA